MSRRARDFRVCVLVAAAFGAIVGSVYGQSDPNPGPNSTQPAAFTGLLQMPEANLFTGSAATSIPIDLPPGRKSLGLKLALQYVSGGGPSLYGYGWDLPLGRIERSTRFGVIGCGNQDHVNDFVLSLPTSTLEFRRAGGVGIPRVQESFVKIVWNSGLNTFTVWDKSGIKYTFGGTFESRSGTDANTADPSFANCTNFSAGTPILYTFSWALTHIEDTNGNDVDITYAKNASGVVHPVSIEYGGTTGNQTFRVEFAWPPNSRPAEDRLVNGLGGFRAELDIVLSDITVKYLKVTPNETIRRYHFDYDVTRVGRRTFLDSVTLYNGATPPQALTRYDGLPATTEFIYHDNYDAAPAQSRFGFDQATSFYYSVSWGGGRFAAFDGDADLDLFDITGDGIADWVRSSPCGSGAQSTWTVRRGSKSGYGASQTWTFTTPGGCIRDGQQDGDYTRTKRDTVDLTGDGIPDYIDGSAAGAWMVHQGYVTATGGGFLTATAWSGSGHDIRRSGIDPGSPSVSYDDADLLDINGDGRPDHVRATATPDIWLVRYNLGAAFSAELYFLTRYHWIRRSQGGDETSGVYDMNGDGLPDQVAVNAAGDGLDVYYNSGQRIGVKPGSTVTGASWPVPAALRPQSLNALDLRNSSTDGAGYTYVKRQLLDVNGDGLPDLVYAPGTGDWVVALNRGNGFSDAQTWRIVPETGQNNLYIRRVSGDWTVEDTYDYDGDGLLDHVKFGNQGGSSLEVRPRRNLGGAWCESFAGVVCNDQPGSVQTHVIPNVSTDPMNPGRGQRPDLLVGTFNSIGAATYLEYRPSTQWGNTMMPFVTWTVTRIEHNDGMCDGAGCITAGGHTTATDVTYTGGMFDGVNRQFRGFGLVDARQSGAASESRLGRLTLFLQGAATAGKAFVTWEYDLKNGGTHVSQPHRITTNFWQCVAPDSGDTKECPAMPDGDVWVRLGQSEAATVSNFTGAQKKVLTINHEWHQCDGGAGTKFYGNVRKSSTGDADGSVRTYTYTEYDCQDDGTTYIVDKPMQVTVRDTADADPPLEQKWFYYDGSTSPGLNSSTFKANVTRVDTWLDHWHEAPPAQDDCPGGGKSCVRVVMTYDSFGNLTSVANHLNNVTATDYDSTTSLYPELVTRAGFHRTKSVHDPKCGVRLSETIPYVAGPLVPSERSQWQYDSFCRLIKTALPGDDIASAPHALYFYSLGGLKVPTKIQSRMREPSAAGGYVDSYTLSDGLGRVIQQQRTAVVIGNTGYLSDTTEYDAQGHAAKRYAPDSVTDFGTFDAPGGAIGFTMMLYDAMDRVIRVTNPDNTTRESDHTVAWQTTTKDECYTSACAGGGAKIVERRDALGRVIERQWFNQDTFETRTVFTYDELGRLTASKQGATLSTLNNNTEITHSYDTLGRKVQTDDADSGVWNYRYDAIGNLKVADDPKSMHHVQYCYDGLQRQTKSCAMNGSYSTPFNCSSGTCPGEQIATATTVPATPTAGAG